MKFIILSSFVLISFLFTSLSYANEEISKLQTTGISSKNEKGVLVLPTMKMRKSWGTDRSKSENKFQGQKEGWR